ncbi:hypothetical protein HMPREF9440_02376 [Sutterella parvirubra YIT 11816]|uniref:Uncharacterized protein n=1 Tax=Sutterella parvirubra YIT 11816 TaxID=762967 RepID=H3KHX9_9BURK|nr:hypothetical protein HMPREF9440_02376 [Sutterella parvirubra YIT 11816]
MCFLSDEEFSAWAVRIRYPLRTALGNLPRDAPRPTFPSPSRGTEQ